MPVPIESRVAAVLLWVVAFGWALLPTPWLMWWMHRPRSLAGPAAHRRAQWRPLLPELFARGLRGAAGRCVRPRARAGLGRLVAVERRAVGRSAAIRAAAVRGRVLVRVRASHSADPRARPRHPRGDGLAATRLKRTGPHYAPSCSSIHVVPCVPEGRGHPLQAARVALGLPRGHERLGTFRGQAWPPRSGSSWRPSKPATCRIRVRHGRVTLRGVLRSASALSSSAGPASPRAQSPWSSASRMGPCISGSGRPASSRPEPAGARAFAVTTDPRLAHVSAHSSGRRRWTQWTRSRTVDQRPPRLRTDRA